MTNLWIYPHLQVTTVDLVPRKYVTTSLEVCLKYVDAAWHCPFGSWKSGSSRKAFLDDALLRVARKNALGCVYGRTIWSRVWTGFHPYLRRRRTG